jgi:hypothetical protein
MYLEDWFEDTKEVMRSRKWKERQNNGKINRTKDKQRTTKYNTEE